jgi:uncharacterized protein with PQ loop repeat
MSGDYLMYCASFLYLSCYVPELYANYKNKNANIYNIPEKIIMFTATSFGLSYALLNNNFALIMNYGPMLSLDIIALLMRIHYCIMQKFNNTNKSNYDTNYDTNNDTNNDNNV